MGLHQPFSRRMSRFVEWRWVRKNRLLYSAINLERRSLDGGLRPWRFSRFSVSLCFCDTAAAVKVVVTRTEALDAMIAATESGLWSPQNPVGIGPRAGGFQSWHDGVASCPPHRTSG